VGGSGGGRAGSVACLEPADCAACWPCWSALCWACTRPAAACSSASASRAWGTFRGTSTTRFATSMCWPVRPLRKHTRPGWAAGSRASFQISLGALAGAWCSRPAASVAALPSTMQRRACAGGPRWTSQGRPDAQRADSPKLIPRVLHQTYQSGAVPPGVRPLMHSWRRHNEDWEIRFYDDEACLKFVQREFPEYLDAFRALPRGVERSHFFRRAAPAAAQGALPVERAAGSACSGQARRSAPSPAVPPATPGTVSPAAPETWSGPSRSPREDAASPCARGGGHHKGEKRG